MKRDISFYVACAFVICLIKYLLTYLLIDSTAKTRHQRTWFELLQDTMFVLLDTETAVQLLNTDFTTPST